MVSVSDRPASRRGAMPPTAPLPAEARAALAAVIADMRDMPRAIIGDPAEVVHFLGRQARRLAGIRDMRVPAALPPAPKSPSAVLMAPAGAAAALQAAEQTFQAAKVTPLADTFSTSTRRSPAAELPQARAVVDRRGRRVPVVLRRAAAAGQLDLPL